MPEEEQKTAYRLLSSHEKSYLWRNKVLNFKATEVLNKEQESFIDYWLIIIKPDLFVADSKSSIEFRSATGKYISEKAKDLFGFVVALAFNMIKKYWLLAKKVL